MYIWKNIHVTPGAIDAKYWEHNKDLYTMLVTNDISAGKAYTYDTGIYYKCPVGNFSSSETSAWYQQEHLKPHQDTLMSGDRNNN